MYKLIVRTVGEIYQLEEAINEAARQGFVYIDMYESNARLVVIMQQAPKVGRPKKNTTSENE